jgi:cyclophilin family peptidyl-prolyl cis-trans isomerase
MGAFVIELNAERAPLTVQNFVRYVNEGFYTNTLFHRVVGGFVVQGGGYDATTMKTKATHEYLVNESGNGLQNTRGSVGMARSGPAHSANSQFYVNLVDNSELDPLPTRWGYAVFGEVTEGMDVIERMGVVATGSVGPFKSEAPLKPIVIEKVEPLTGTPAPAAAPPSATPPAPESGESGDNPSATPGETSNATSADPAAATSGETSGTTPGETSAATSGDTSGATSENTSGATPGETSGDAASAGGGDTSAETSGGGETPPPQ